MTEKKADESKPVKVEIIAKKPINVQQRGLIYPGSVVELPFGMAQHVIKLKWAKKSDAKLNLVIPEDIAVQLGKKGGAGDA